MELAATAALLGAALAAFSRFVSRVESRPGAVLPDPLLALFAPRDLTWLTFTLVYAGLAVALISLLGRPARLLLGLQAYAVMVLLRIGAMWLVPLDPPPRMIPLGDPFVRLFGPGEVLTRDLFFSGHTASLFLFFLVAPTRTLRALFFACTVAVGVAVLAQHVHYAIDVYAAPAFAFAAYSLARLLRGGLGLPAA